MKTALVIAAILVLLWDIGSIGITMKPFSVTFPWRYFLGMVFIGAGLLLIERHAEIKEREKVLKEVNKAIQSEITKLQTQPQQP